MNEIETNNDFAKSLQIELLEKNKEIERIKENAEFHKKSFAELHKRISKALEYIEENSDDMHTYISQVLTSILIGVDKE